MTSFLLGIGYAGIGVGVMVLGAYGVSLVRKRNDVADVFWGWYFIAAIVGAYLSLGLSIRISLIPLGLIMIWAIRLSTHIAQRHLRTDEDPRYRAWRQAWMARGEGYFRIRSFIQVFLLQGILALIVVSPGIFLAASFNGSIQASAYVFGIAIWVFGFLFESIADRQLKNFFQSPEHKGTIMRSGLWAYSRHPNYFGEIVQWVGIWVMTLPLGWFTVIGPITIYGLIVYVSGIPLAEKGMESLAGFEDYRSVTSPLVPVPHWLSNLASPRTLAAILIEFGPLLLFFVTFEFFDFFTSVLILVGAVVLALYGSIRLYRKISLFPIVSSGSVILFGLLTVITHQSFWIIFKDTLYFGIFGLVILIPLFFRVLVLKMMFVQVFAITDRAWKWVSWNWSLFMIAVAVSNEVVRIRLSPESWVHYKMVVLGIVVVFSIMQFVIASRERLPEASILGLRK